MYALHIMLSIRLFDNEFRDIEREIEIECMSDMASKSTPELRDYTIQFS